MTHSIIFSKIKNTFANPRADNVRENVIVSGGDGGCEDAIKMAMFLKSQGRVAGALILMCSDVNRLRTYVKRGAKYVQKDRIFAVHIALRNGGNGKSLEVGINNFLKWKNNVDRILPKFIQVINKQGSYNLFCFTSTGGSGSPVVVYFNKLVDDVALFERKFIIIVEARDEFSMENQNEIIMRMCKIQNARVILATNQEDNPSKSQLVDFGNAGAVLGSIAVGCFKWDTSDYYIRLSKFSVLKVGMNTIPIKNMLFWREQNYEKTLNAMINLYRAVRIQKNDWCIVVGDVLPDIVKQGSEQVQPKRQDRGRYDLSVAGVKLVEWNVVCGRLRSGTPQVVMTTNFDRLDELMGRNEDGT